MKSSIHTEATFETAIIEHLISIGWKEGDAGNFDKSLALDKQTILSFIVRSQEKEWEKLKVYYKEDTENKFFQRLYKELDLRGMLDVLRHGITDSGVKFKLAYFKPDSKLNPDTYLEYQKNELSVTRQVHYSLKNNNSIDLLLSLNGLPVATIELKNHFTGQSIQDAILQYKNTRDPKELLFQWKKRALVHFAVDPDEVHLTTKLDGDNTKFLPFNKGNGSGAGNPLNPNGYKTSYFWEEILSPDSWMELLSRFLHLRKEVFKIDGKNYTKESTLFPRYHQIDVVRKISLDAKRFGPGKKYLIQHSAGSGKSNSIAWLAYRLSSLYDDADKKIFDSVIVITDRTVLDRQLQDTIYQFEHKQGVVQRIDDDSKQLANAIQFGTNIIITTLQKFPFALKHLNDLPDRNYAVIIDEAHSSQGGESSKNMAEALSSNHLSLEESEEMERQFEENSSDDDDLIREAILKRGPQKNLSIFAFTATPKAKTLEVFGIQTEVGKFVPFHLYSMRQAIEEKYILDVLKNYITYKEYYRISKTIADDPELNKKKALQAIGRFASLHPHNISQKIEVIVEHFRKIIMPRIGGKAKAMVVTSSRRHALEYYLRFKEYIKEKGYTGIDPLVAFSGVLYHDLYKEGIREAQLNQFGEKELPEKFGEGEKYRVLLVADKYQTGFDQPLLHTMYVDKKIIGVKAVQTLSRLNRTYPGKEDALVIDFANERQTILDSFQPYYELTSLEEPSDPNRLYDLKAKLDSAYIYYQSEVDGFAKVFYREGNQTAKSQSRLYSFIDPSIDRFKGKNEEEQDLFKKALIAYLRGYGFLSQIMPFQDVDLEKLYSFGRYLVLKIPKTSYIEKLQLDDDVALEFYRLKKLEEADLVLKIQGEANLDGEKESAGGKDVEEKVKLSDIIRILNEKFGTDFREIDKLFFNQVEEELYQDDQLKTRAQNNPIENFKYAFDEIFINKLIERMDNNQDIFDKIMGNSEFKKEVESWMLLKVFNRFNEK
ncbi:type I restriction endonuclease subunit R [Leptospira sp. WS92.C1]